MSKSAMPPGKRPAGSSRAGTGRSATARKAPAKKRPGRVRRAMTWLLVTGLVLVLVATGVFYFSYRNTEIPTANAAFEAQATYVYYSGGEERIGTFAEQNRESVPLAEIPQSMQDAAIAAEDRTFYSNRGIDPRGIVRAAFSNAQGNATQGASTITQQYVKLLYLNQERTLGRKAKEAFLSLKVHEETSKEEILEGYLNTIYFGRGAYGVQAASRAFFGVPANQLNARQSAMLAAVLNNPSSLSPDGGREARQRLLGRYQYVLDGMVEMDALDASRAARARERLPRIVPRNTANSYGEQRGFMLTMIKDELESLGFDEQDIESGGLRVETTLTKRAMAANREGVEEQRPEGLKGLHVASASVDNRTGALLGFFAGQNYLDSQLNWAQLGGSPGSSFKTFALAAGLQSGFSLRDTFDGNAPYTFDDGGEVGNQGEGTGTNFGSAISLLTATQNSVNTAYADLTDALPNGPEDVLEMAVKMGIPRNAPGLEPNNAISLGSATISPIAMASAYSTVASGGVHRDVHLIRKVSRASDGKALYQVNDKSERAFSEDIAADVSYALQQVVSAGTGFQALNLGRPAAGKTGTATNDDGDVSSSWFVGYTPQVSTAVMYVRGKGNQALNGFLPTFYGGEYPARTWTAIMARLMDGREVETFPPPVFLDGTAPEEGHEPYTPPPEPEPAPPEDDEDESPEPEDSASVEPEPEPEPSEEPTQPSEPAEPSQPEPEPGGDQGGGGQGGDQGGRGDDVLPVEP